MSRTRIVGNRLVIGGATASPRRSCRHRWHVNNGRTTCMRCGRPHPDETPGRPDDQGARRL